ncbi:M20/M25/M40 family metallo-hydrolase [Actinosynnema sp. NPDC020468]|uniref:M20/M25/M40 family metallo-hydrolase n=1 Tax=Actinosynnema sp. NPDC020468 TaxID=3154488 RepID=UPI0033C14F43
MTRSRAVPALLAVVAAVGFVAVQAFRPPAPAGADAPADRFSAERAFAHVEQIARRPHPVGSAENERVRGYVADQARRFGARVELQDGRVAVPRKGVVRIAVAHNVVARVPGTDPSGKALLVVAHHDSVATGPGASDDGAAVAAMLESLRVLGTRPVRNDVVFLFTDGEEMGLLGAEAFVRANGVDRFGAVLNFEARGSGGPVWMFQTGPGNADLVTAFAGASSRPIANSLAYEVYRRMPNSSDFTVFRDAGATGLDSAFIEHVEDYHSPYDDLAHLDRGSLQHHGETITGLVAALGAADLTAPRGSDAVYFDLFSRVLVHYPTWLGAVLAVLTVLGYVVVVVVRRLRVAPLLAVAGIAVGAVAVAAGAAFGVWALIAWARPGLAFLALSEPPERGWFVAGFLALGLATLFAAARLLRRFSHAEVLGGVLGLAAVLLVATTAFAPGVGFLFQWPLLLGLPALWWTTRPLLAVLAPLTAAALYPPLVGTLLVALGMPLAAAGVLFALLGGILLAPLLKPLRGNLITSGAIALVAVALLGVGTARFSFDGADRRPDSLIYLLDAEKGSADWLSADPATDAWTGKALGANPDRVDLTADYPVLDRPVLRATAPVFTLPAPTVAVSSDTTAGAERAVDFVVRPTGRTWRTQLTLPRAGLRGCQVGADRLDPKSLPGKTSLTFEFYGPGELSCRFDAGPPVTATVVDHWIGLPDEAAAVLGPRPPDAMPVQSGNRPFDATLVRTTLRR